MLRYYSPTIIGKNSGYIDGVPGDMPTQYVYDRLSIDGTSDSPAYRSLGAILADGWEPYQTIKEDSGVTQLFKMKVDYMPGCYEGPVSS